MRKLPETIIVLWFATVALVGLVVNFLVLTGTP